MKTTTMNTLISERPKAYSWFRFQRFSLWLFLVFAIVFLVNAGIIIVSGLIKCELIDEASKKIAEKFQVNQANVYKVMVKYLNPINCKVILYSFFLSVSFFIIARYCKKIINRNKYIVKLEEEWIKFTSIDK